MKIFNVKKLILKFFGGGIIKFPTRFLRWVIIEPIECDDGGDDDEGGGDSDINLETLIIDFDELGSFSGETSMTPQQGTAWNEVILRNNYQTIIPTSILLDLAANGPAHEIYGIDLDNETYYDDSDQGEGTFQPHTWYLLTSTEGEHGMPECEVQVDLGESGLLFKTGAPGE